jgi:hypothetical protein
MKKQKHHLTFASSMIAIVISVVALMQIRAAYGQQSISPSNNVEDIHEAHMAAGGNAIYERIPTMPGQEAFGTIQEIMNILNNDPNTDWSQVDIEALRQHLIDMNEVTMNARLTTQEVPGGIHVDVAGDTERTVAAIWRMVTTHNSMTLETMPEWDTAVVKRADGIALTVTSESEGETEKIRGFGFIGIMATGANHPAHHLMMAKGAMHAAR